MISAMWMTVSDMWFSGASRSASIMWQCVGLLLHRTMSLTQLRAPEIEDWGGPRNQLSCNPVTKWPLAISTSSSETLSLSRGFTWFHLVSAFTFKQHLWLQTSANRAWVHPRWRWPLRPLIEGTILRNENESMPLQLADYVHHCLCRYALVYRLLSSFITIYCTCS